MEEISTLTEEKNGKVYEFAFLLVPTIPEEGIAGAFGELKAILEKVGATFVSEELPHLITLAYEMSRVIANKKTKFSSGYFGWIKFELDPALTAEFKNTIDRREEMIRYLIIKTVRENTVASKKSFVHGGDARRRTYTKKEEVPGVPVDSEAIDKEIDALVVDAEPQQAS